MTGQVVAALLGFAVLVLVGGIVVARTGRPAATPTERAVHTALRTAALAARPLRAGLSADSARDAVGPLRTLLGTDVVFLADADGTVLGMDSFERVGAALRATCAAAAAEAAAGRRTLLDPPPDAGARAVVAQPIVADGQVVGVLGVGTAGRPGAGTLQAVAEVADYVGGQLELTELAASRARLDRAELIALRAQISPHFIYNALTTIASFVRTDPARARELLLEFADFTRYSFRAAGQYSALADELQNIDRYLALERARFGPGLEVRLHVAPEVLRVVLPFLALQPLVENAVRHGLAGRNTGTITVTAGDAGPDCLISVEDDGVGMDPELLRSGDIDALGGAVRGKAAGGGSGAHVGLTNVDHRLRAAFGNDYGLVVETAPGAGTKVSLRVPKFAPGVAVEGR